MGIQLGSAYGKVIIDASGVRKGVDEAQSSLKAFKQGFHDVAKGIQGAGVTITGVVVTMKKAFDFGKEGAAVTQMGQSFDTLLAKVGAAPDLLDRLRASSLGTVSDMKLMSSTALLLAGVEDDLAQSFADALPRIMDIAKAANKLNPTLGDTTFLFDSLARGIKRNSPLIIDNTGLVVKVEEAYQTLAAQLGKNADELTAVEQKQALLNAVLAAGENLIAQAGGTTESATDSFERMEASVENAADALKAKFAPAIAASADGLYWLLTFSDQVNDALKAQEDQALSTGMAYEEYVYRQTEALTMSGKMTESTREAIRSGLVSRETLEQLSQTYGELTDAKLLDLYASGRITAAQYDEYYAHLVAAQGLDEVINSFGLMTEANYEAEQSTRRTTKALDEAGPYMSDMIAQWEKMSKSAGKAAMSQDEFNAGLDTLNRYISGELGRETEEYAQKQADLATEIEAVAMAIVALERKKEKQGGKLWGKDKKELEELKGKYDELKGKYDEDAEAHREATARILFDIAQINIANSGLSFEQQLAALQVMADQLGLVDTATQQADLAFKALISEANQQNGGNLGEAMAYLSEQIMAGKSAADALKGALAILNGTVVDVYVNVHGAPGQIGAGLGGGHGGPPIAMEAAGVSNFTIPPGFPADSYLMGLTSGEQVTVERAGTPADGRGGGYTWIIQQHNYNPAAAAISNAEIRRMRRGRFDRRMGVG